MRRLPRRRRLVLSAVAAAVTAGLLPQAAVQAIPQEVSSCTATSTGSAGCYFRCIEDERINVTVINETNQVKVTGTIRCGSQTANGPTSSGQAPPFNTDSDNIVMKDNYTPDDSVDPANCYTNTAPGATISIKCAPARDPSEALGAGPATGTTGFSPALTLANASTAFSLSGSAPMTVVYPLGAGLYAGPVTFSGSGSSDGGENCGFGHGDIGLALNGTGGVGSLSGSGIGRYQRIGNALRVVVAVNNLTVGGALSPSTTFVLDGVVASTQSCWIGSQPNGSFSGLATIGS